MRLNFVNLAKTIFVFLKMKLKTVPEQYINSRPVF
jgi:hypothetical protein